MKATKELFIENTIAAVARVGMENLRTKMVADAADFSEATMFRFFADKDEMLCETFLEVDRRMSNVFLNLFDPEKFNKLGFKEALHDIWNGIFSYLLSHKEETLYMIRFRYSALYTDEIRNQRMAYNGSFEKVYDYIAGQNESSQDIYRGFFLNYLFEMTICFAEKIVTGRINLDEDVKPRLWNAVSAAADAFCS